MKNIQVIDGADNCTYDIFAVSDEQFAAVFPNGQDIEFSEDLVAGLSQTELRSFFEGFWDNRLDKKDVVGIHGTLLYELEFKKRYYPTKIESEMVSWPQGDDLEEDEDSVYSYVSIDLIVRVETGLHKDSLDAELYKHFPELSNLDETIKNGEGFPFESIVEIGNFDEDSYALISEVIMRVFSEFKDRLSLFTGHKELRVTLFNDGNSFLVDLSNRAIEIISHSNVKICFDGRLSPYSTKAKYERAYR